VSVRDHGLTQFIGEREWGHCMLHHEGLADQLNAKRPVLSPNEFVGVPIASNSVRYRFMSGVFSAY